MCGIVGVHFKNPRDTGIQHKKLERFVTELLLGIEPRGKDATGLLTVDAKGVPTLVKADCKASTFVDWRQPVPKRVQTILGHTRFATQGTPTVLENDHPVQYGTCFAIHNGHISNDKDLFEEHSLERIAEVDSEIIPALFNKYGLDKAHLALQQFEGNMATAVVDPDRFPNITVLAKGWSSPVEVWESKHAVVWASTEDAILKACEKALGFRLNKSKLTTMHAGDILYMEGSSIELLEFEPKLSSYKLYTTSYGSGYSSYSRKSYAYSPSTGAQTTNPALYDECSACGCKRLWHDKTGKCSNKIELSVGNGVWSCRCEEFKLGKTAKREPAWEYCDGCGRQFAMGDLKQMGEYYFCPTYCASALFPSGPTSQELRKSAEEVISDQMVAAEELSDGDEWSNAAWEARENTLHEEVLKFASAQVGLTPEFIDWVLYKAPIEIFDADKTGYLARARELADEAYKLIEHDLRTEVVDVEIVRWQSGDMRGGLPDVSEEACGVVVEMEEWKLREIEAAS